MRTLGGGKQTAMREGYNKQQRETQTINTHQVIRETGHTREHS